MPVLIAGKTAFVSAGGVRLLRFSPPHAFACEVHADGKCCVLVARGDLYAKAMLAMAIGFVIAGLVGAWMFPEFAKAVLALSGIAASGCGVISLVGFSLRERIEIGETQIVVRAGVAGLESTTRSPRATGQVFMSRLIGPARGLIRWRAWGVLVQMGERGRIVCVNHDEAAVRAYFKRLQHVVPEMCFDGEAEVAL
ncbi:MAG TPA: hypothetical protein VK157_08605 [Phycisphaerales bacterium]|nr:hypothetical protein [Phycisphaerales bacterium]